MSGKIKFTDLHITKSNKYILIFELHSDAVYEAKKTVAKVKEKVGKMFALTVSEWREKRSLDANAYAWLLIDKLAKKIGSTKEEIYLEIIRKVGSFEIIPIKDEAVDEWIRKWNIKGLGWVSETMGESKIKGYTNTINYFGSSVYNTKEMAILIDEIITECENNDIETLPPNEVERLKSLWAA